jgi:hypothetical protein
MSDDDAYVFFMVGVLVVLPLAIGWYFREELRALDPLAYFVVAVYCCIYLYKKYAAK